MLALALSFVLGEHPARIDLVHMHAVHTHEGIPQVSGERHERAFANRVGHQIRFATVGIHAADVQHVPARFA